MLASGSHYINSLETHDAHRTRLKIALASWFSPSDSLCTLTMSSRRKRVRYTFDIHFSAEAEKDAFIKRLSSVRTLLSMGESNAAMDNFGMMSAMFDLVEGFVPSAPSAGNERQTTRSFMRSNGKLNYGFSNF